MSHSKAAKHYDGVTRNLLAKSPKETKQMNAAMDAMDENLDKLSSALNDRFRKLVSTQIRLIKDTDPNFQPTNIKVNIKHREIRKAYSPSKYSSQNDEDELSGIDQYESEQTATTTVNKKGITEIHINKYYRDEIRGDEIPQATDDINSAESNGDKSVKSKYKKVTYKQQLLTKTNAGVKTTEEKMEFRSLQSPSKDFTSADIKLADLKNKSPTFSTHRARNPVLGRIAVKSPETLSNTGGSSSLGRSDTGGGPLTVRYSPRNTEKKHTSPVSQRKPANTTGTLRNTAISSIKKRKDVSSPISPKSTIESLLRDKVSNTRYSGYTGGNSSQNRVTSPKPTVMRHLSPLSARSGNTSPHPSSPRSIGSSERNPVHQMKRHISPLSDRRSGSTSPLSPTNRAISPRSTRSGQTSSVPLIKRHVSPLSTRKATATPSSSMSRATSPRSTNGVVTSPVSTTRARTRGDASDQPAMKRHTDTMSTRSRSASPLSPMGTATSPVSASSGIKSPLSTMRRASSPLSTKSFKENSMSVRSSVTNPVYLSRTTSPSPLPHESDKSIPQYELDVIGSPTSAKDDAHYRGSGGIVIKRELRNAERSPGVKYSPQSNSFSDKVTDNLTAARRDMEGQAAVPRTVSGSPPRSLYERSTPLYPSMALRLKNPSARSADQIQVRTQNPAVLRKTMPSPLGRKLHTMVERLEDYNNIVSPRMGKIKESLSPRKAATGNWLVPATKYLEQSIATAESSKYVEQIKKTSITEAVKSPTGDAITARTYTETATQSVATISPSKFTHVRSISTSTQSEHESFPTQSFNTSNKHVAKTMTIRKEFRTSPLPTPDVAERRNHTATANRDVNGAELTNRTFEMISPATDDTSTKYPNIKRKLHFSSPTELPTGSTVSNEFVEDLSTGPKSMNVFGKPERGLSNSFQSSNNEDSMLLLRSIRSEDQPHSDSESSTFLLESLYDSGQGPLVHSTPVPVDSTVRYLSIKQDLPKSEKSFESNIGEEKGIYCASCFEKENKHQKYDISMGSAGASTSRKFDKITRPSIQFDQTKSKPSTKHHSVLADGVHKKVADITGKQTCTEVSREVTRLKRGDSANVSEKHHLVKEVDCCGHNERRRIRQSSYTERTLDGTKDVQQESFTVKQLEENSAHACMSTEKKICKQIKQEIYQAEANVEKATQANTRISHGNQQIAHLLNETYRENRENEPEPVKPRQREDKTALRKEIVDIQTKCTTGSQTEIIEKQKKLIRHEQSSQTDIYVQEETSQYVENKAGESVNVESKYIHKERAHRKASLGNREDREVHVETLKQAYDDIQERLHVSATATLVSAAKDALKKAVDDDFHRELWIALHENVHRLHDDFETFTSAHLEPKGPVSSTSNANEWDYKIQNRIETLLSLCNNLDRDEFREHIEQLIGRLRTACFEQGAQSRATQYTDEMNSLLSGLTNLTENFAVCGERLLGRTSEGQCDDVQAENDPSEDWSEPQQCSSAFITTANKTVMKLLNFYSGRTRQLSKLPSVSKPLAEKDREPRTLLGHLDGFLQRHMVVFVLIFGVILGVAVVYCGPPVARIAYKCVIATVMYIWCSLRLVHTNPPIV